MDMIFHSALYYGCSWLFIFEKGPPTTCALKQFCDYTRENPSHIHRNLVCYNMHLSIWIVFLKIFTITINQWVKFKNNFTTLWKIQLLVFILNKTLALSPCGWNLWPRSPDQSDRCPSRCPCRKPLKEVSFSSRSSKQFVYQSMIFPGDHATEMYTDFQIVYHVEAPHYCNTQCRLIDMVNNNPYNQILQSNTI